MQQSNGKELALGILTVAVGLANAYLWKGVVLGGGLGPAALYSLPVLALFAFAILFSLSSAFIRRRLTRAATAIASLTSGYLFVPFSGTVAAAAAASALAGWYAADEIAHEEKDSARFSTRKILRGGLPVFFTAVALTLAVFYFVTVSDQHDQTFLPKAMFDAAIPLLQRPLAGILPGFRSDASVDDLMLAFAAAQIGKEFDIGTLTPAERERLVAESRRALATELGIKLSGDEKAGDVLYEVTNAQVAKLLGPYHGYLPAIAAVGFFIAVKAITMPVYWITLLLVWLVVKCLVAAGILRQKTETVEVTRIGL